MKLRLAVMLCAAITLVPACHEPTSGVVVGKGTILGAQAECSSWFLRTDSGTLYELRGLATDFQQVNLRVHFVVRETSAYASACMRGSMAEVMAMKKL